MNVNTVGPSDSTDIRKAAIEAAMINKEETDAEIIESARKHQNLDCIPRWGFVILFADRLESAAAQIKSQADRIAELEANLPSADTYRAAMDERAKLAQRVAELEKDAKRLDWMDATAFTAYHHRDAEHGNLNLYSVVVNEDAENRIGRTGPFIREAIDAAMNERKE